jgi:hypothetical protein
MGTDDAQSDLDRELTRLKLRDVVIGSAVAAVLLAMMPGHAQRGAMPAAGGRARVSTPLLPKPKPDCAKHTDDHCDGPHHAMRHTGYLIHGDTAAHTVDIRV